MERNVAQVGPWTLTVSMATLYGADKALLAEGKPPVMEAFRSLLGSLVQGEMDLTRLDLTGIDFETLAIVLHAFLHPAHKLTFKKALEGPLMDGSPVDWMGAVFQLLLGQSPQAGDAGEDDDSEIEPEGNAPAA
ncbi:MAG: hypothetical protein WBF53_12035 [Litorimonas sp.]